MNRESGVTFFVVLVVQANERRRRLRYSEVIYAMKKQEQFNFRKELVCYAAMHGVKPAARYYRCSPNTVRLWLGRYRQEGNSGLYDRSRAPHRCPHKTSAEEEAYVLSCRRQVPAFGPRRLREYFSIGCSEGAIARILRHHGLVESRRKRHHKKNDLREMKARYRAFEKVMVDVKYLTDISHYWPQMHRYKLPRYQYTARDVKTGALFLGFAGSVSETYACIYITRLLGHLKAHGIDLGQVTIQTDCGSEFSGTRVHHDRGFVHTVNRLGARHKFIPPATPNANSDVETSHHHIEREFYDLEGFQSKGMFLQKAKTYQYWWNYGRTNQWKGHRTPLEILSKEVGGKRSVELLNLEPKLLKASQRDRTRKSNNRKIHPGVQHLPILADGARLSD